MARNIPVCLALTFCFLLLASARSIAQGCSIETSYTIYPTHVNKVGACTGNTEAQQACIDFAADHDYGAGACFLGGNGAWNAGWLKESAVGGPSGNGIYPPFYLGHFYPAEFYVTAEVRKEAQCDLCVGDPINPASGAVFGVHADLASDDSTLGFRRYFNSALNFTTNLSANWRHSYSRSIKSRLSAITYKPFTSGNPNNSSLYSSASLACTGGFAQIKSKVDSWSTATATYSNGICRISSGTTTTAVLQVYSKLDAPFTGSAPVAFDAIRDDGQVITFWINASEAEAPPSIRLKLQQTSSGYTLTDENDAVETYDSDGKLLSITSRGGVAQTMGYDESGRLSTVTDSFGRSLTLTYDSQSRVSTVTRQ